MAGDRIAWSATQRQASGGTGCKGGATGPYQSGVCAARLLLEAVWVGFSRVTKGKPPLLGASPQKETSTCDSTFEFCPNLPSWPPNNARFRLDHPTAVEQVESFDSFDRTRRQSSSSNPISGRRRDSLCGSGPFVGNQTKSKAGG